MATRTEPGRLLNLSEVAERTGLSLHTIRRWASLRRLPIVKISNRVFVTERDLDRLIESWRRDARSELAV